MAEGNESAGGFWKFWFLIAATSGLILLGVAFALSRAHSRQSASELSPHPLPEFQLVDQLNRPVSRASLLGQVWVASFIYTTCTGPCPMMSYRMSEIQRALAGVAGVKCVSITADPEHDTPGILAQYARQFHADPERWLFLSGSKEQIAQLAIRGFYLADAGPMGTLSHSTQFALVNRSGVVVRYFDGLAPDVVEQIRNEVRRLASTSGR